MPGTGLVKGGMKAIYRVGKGIAHHPKTSLVLGVLGWSRITGTPIVDIAGDVVLGKDDLSKKGLVPSVADIGFGDGTTEKVTQKADSVIEQIKEGTEHLQAMAQEKRELSFMQGGRAPYSLPVVEPSGLYAMLGDQGAMQAGDGGGWGSRFSQWGMNTGGMSSLIDKMTGNGWSAKNIAGLGAAAWLMFGRWGFMARLAGALLGGYALNSVTAPNQASIPLPRSNGTGYGLQAMYDDPGYQEYRKRMMQHAQHARAQEAMNDDASLLEEDEEENLSRGMVHL